MRKRGLSEADEPRVIPKYKPKKTKALNNVCGMALSQWKLLLFPYLELVELIQLQRSCKTFAGYPDLRKLIQIKRLAAFKGIRKESWNKFAKTNKMWTDLIPLFEKHKGKFILAEMYRGCIKRTNTIAAFSSKHRLVCAIYEKLSNVSHITIDRDDSRYIMFCHQLMCSGLTEDDLEAFRKPEEHRKVGDSLPNLDDYL